MPLVQHSMIYVMGIDPGGTTGWSILGVERDSIFGDAPSGIRHLKTGLIRGGFTQQVLRLAVIIRTYHDPFYSLALAVESFIPRKPIMDEQFLAPLQINYRLQFLADTGKIRSPIFYQTPQFAMEDAPDSRLKKWGIFVSGEDHPKDATRHAIAFIRRCRKDRSLAEQAWPSNPTEVHRISQMMPDGRSSGSVKYKPEHRSRR
jgi:hypothetical protein